MYRNRRSEQGLANKGEPVYPPEADEVLRGRTSTLSSNGSADSFRLPGRTRQRGQKRLYGEGTSDAAAIEQYAGVSASYICEST